MIGQYLSSKNESAIVAKSEIFSELNKVKEVRQEVMAESTPLLACLLLTHTQVETFSLLLLTNLSGHTFVPFLKREKF